MPFVVDSKTQPGILRLELSGVLGAEEMAAFLVAHNEGVDSFGHRDYRVFCDIRTLMPLSPECAALFEKAKAYSAAHANFRGSAVLVSGALASMQHRRTSIAGGVMDTELITEDEAACWRHLSVIKRTPLGITRPK